MVENILIGNGVKIKESKKVLKVEAFKWYLIHKFGMAILALFILFHIPALGITPEKLIEFFTNDSPIVIYAAFILLFFLSQFDGSLLRNYVKVLKLKL